MLKSNKWNLYKYTYLIESVADYIEVGRPGKDTVIDKRTEYIDSVDRIEVERKFGLSKHSHGLGLIMTKREDTTRSSIVLSIISMNLDSLLRLSLFQKLILIFSRYNCCYILCESVG